MKNPPGRAHLSGALLALLVASLAACTELCSLVNCEDGFEIRAVSSEPLASGRYDIAITLEGRSGSCTAFVPPSAGSASCDASLPVSVSASETAFVIGVHAAPSVVTLRVEYGDQTVGEAEFKPKYRSVQPNGPDCEPTCHVADAQEFALAP
jgi:hypothetical protein